MTARGDDALYTAVDTSRTKGVAYATAYAKYQTCMKNNASNANQATVCSSFLTAATTAATDFNGQLGTTNTLGTDRAADSTYLNASTYAVSKPVVIATDASNRKKQQELQDLEEGTDYAMAKREADAVVYAWTLWVLVFFITAAAVFMYT
jgi:hypothetical protein